MSTIDYPVRALSLAVLIMVIGLIAVPSVAANPFMGGDTSSSPAPVAVSGGSGPFVQSQLSLRDRMAAALRDFKAHPSPLTVGGILLAAFIYGLLHAAGPGHRKTVVFSLFLTRRAQPLEPLAAGLLSAGSHAGCSILLIGILSLISGAIAHLSGITDTGTWLEGGTFLLLAIISLLLSAFAVRDLITGGESGGQSSSRSLYMIVFLTSLVPCPGATMVLLFALYLKLPTLGIFAVLAMSLGMAVVISSTGYLAWAGRTGLFEKLKHNGKIVGRFTAALSLASYLFMLSFSLWAVWPFLASVI